MDEADKKITAYHEAGHAIVGIMLKEQDPIYKITIIPRGYSLGSTVFLPEKDTFNYSKIKLENQISTMLGGRIAEELIFGKDYITTGASNDIERATEIATNMVTKWGLSSAIGPIRILSNNNPNNKFFNKNNKDYYISDDTRKIIDKEVKNIIEKSYQQAFAILEDNIEKLKKLSNKLLKYETLEKKQIEDILFTE